MKPYYEHAGITIYHGDCREILPQLAFDVIIADPPYGINLDTDYARPSKPASRTYERIIGDDSEFDPAPFLAYPRVILFGANHYADKLPPSKGWIVWDKITRNDVVAGQISDCEFAWSNFLPRSRVFRHMWNGGFRESERGTHFHPTQKPIALMKWCIQLLPYWDIANTVLDPYCGSGATLIAAKDLGKLAVGIEIEEKYCEIAAKRLSQEVLQF